MSDNGEVAKSGRKKPQLSDEERKRRSEHMKKLRAEGRAGPEFGKLGGRPKKPRASELIAQEAEKHRSEIAQVLKDAIDPSQPISIRLKGVAQWLDVERDERRVEMEEEEHLAKMGKDELVDHIASKLSENPLVLKMFVDRMNDQEIINGTAREITRSEELPSGD